MTVGDKNPPKATQRILLCAPSAFRARGLASHSEASSGTKIVMPSPGRWYARRSRIDAGRAASGWLSSPSDWKAPSPKQSATSGDMLSASSVPTSLVGADVEATLSTTLLASRWLKVQRQRARKRIRIAPAQIVRSTRHTKKRLSRSVEWVTLRNRAADPRYVAALAFVFTAAAVSAVSWYRSSSVSPVAAHVDIVFPAAFKIIVPTSPVTPVVLPAIHSVARLVSTSAIDAKNDLANLAPGKIGELPEIVVAPVHIGTADGLDLDITSPHSLWAKAGARYGVDPVLIYAVALVETRATQEDGSVAPSPWMVRINGHLHNGTRAQSEHAIELADLLAVPVQDVGIMQVYYPMHRDIEPNPIALLNPVRNIDVGTSLLRQAMRESSDPVLQIGYYHSHDTVLARGYGQTVLDVYHQFKGVLGKHVAAVGYAPRKNLSAPATVVGG